MRNLFVIFTIIFFVGCSPLGLGVPNESEPSKLNAIGAMRLDKQQRPDGAALAFKMAIEEATRRNNSAELAIAYNGLGRVYMFPHPRKNPDLAEEYYRKSLNINISLGRKYYTAENHANLAEIFFDIKKDKKAACTELAEAQRLTNPFVVQPGELCEGVSASDVSAQFATFLERQKVRVGCN